MRIPAEQLGPLETFRAESARRQDGDGLPRFVEDEFRAFDASFAYGRERNSRARLKSSRKARTTTAGRPPV